MGRAKKRKGEANPRIAALIQKLYRLMSGFIFKVICKASIISSILMDTTCAGKLLNLMNKSSCVARPVLQLQTVGSPKVSEFSSRAPCMCLQKLYSIP